MKDVAAERAVLAGIFKGGINTYIDISDIITKNSFTIDTHQLLYSCFEHSFKVRNQTSLDLASVWSAVNDLGCDKILNKKEERDLVRAILNFDGKLENVRKFAAKIRKLEVGRSLGETLDEAKENLYRITGDESLQHILGLVEDPIINFASLLNVQHDNEPKLIGDGLDAYIDYIENNPVQQMGIPSGFPNYDKAIGGGFRRKSISLVGARTKIGKSVHSVCVATHVAGKLNIPVLLLDTEMSAEDQWARLLAKFSKVEIDEIETGRYIQSEDKKRRVHEAKDFLKKAPFSYLSIAGQPFEDTIAIMRRWVSRKVGLCENGRTKDCLVIFDYLKLMSGDRINDAMKEYQVMGFMMTGLHNFAHKYDLPCLSYVQLNRDGIEKESTDVISQSDRIAWLCSNFSIYKKKSDEEIAEERSCGFKNTGNRKLIPIISRYGPCLENDKDYIDMKFEGKFATITEGKLHSQMRSDNFGVTDSNGTDIQF